MCRMYSGRQLARQGRPAYAEFGAVASVRKVARLPRAVRLARDRVAARATHRIGPLDNSLQVIAADVSPQSPIMESIAAGAPRSRYGRKKPNGSN